MLKCLLVLLGFPRRLFQPIYLLKMNYIFLILLYSGFCRV